MLKNVLEGCCYGRLEMLLSEAGVNPVHARPLFNAVQRKLLREGIASLDAILRPVRTWLAGGDAPEFCGIEEVDRTPSADGLTQKSARSGTFRAS